MHRPSPSGATSRLGMPLAAFLCVTMASCGGSDVPTGPADGIDQALISVTPEAIRLDALGDTARATARVIDATGDALGGGWTTWSSSDPSIVSVRSDGLITAMGPGSAQVVVQVDDLVGYVSVSVVQVPWTVEVDPVTPILNGPGDTLQAVGIARDRLGAPVEGVPFVWTTADASVAHVGEDGLLTAVATGTTTLTATSGPLTASVPVTVTAVPGSLSTDPDSLRFVSLGDERTIAVAVRDTGGDEMDAGGVQWRSADPTVAVVSDGVVRAIGNGTTWVEASAGPLTDSVHVVVDQVPASLHVLPESIAMNGPGDTLGASATVRDAGGSPIEGPSIAWSVGNTAVAMVDSDGLVTALASGETWLRATHEGLMDEVALVVTQTPASIELTPDAASLEAGGDTLRIAAVVKDGSGNPIEGAAVSWISSDTAVIDVYEGLLRSAAPGTATVTASAGPTSAVLSVVVAAPVSAPSFAADINPIFRNDGCLSCHGGGGAGGLALSTDPSTSYANLVDVPSRDAPAYLRVERYDSFDSYLVMKLEGRQLSGSAMPLGRGSLSAAKISKIKQWIDAGAPNNE